MTSPSCRFLDRDYISNSEEKGSWIIHTRNITSININSVVFPTIRHLLVFLLLINVCFSQGKHNYQFVTIDINDGLSLNSIITIAKDKYGFMWFGTEDGLNRYDGSTFKIFRHDPLDSTSLISNSVISTLVDSQGNLWVGNYSSGLNKYDYATESFLLYPADPTDSLSLGNGAIYTLLEDYLGYIWVGTVGSGLYRLDPKTGRSTPLDRLVANGKTLPDPAVYGLLEDHLNNLWISTLEGVCVLDLKTFQLKTYNYDSKAPNSLYDDNVNHVSETFDGQKYRIWVGTNWGGLDQYDPENDNFIHHGFKSSINPNYPETSVTWIVQENEDRFWVGTDSKGIIVMDGQGHIVDVIKRKVYDDTALNDDVIQCFYDDGDIIWVGTSSGGIGKFIRNRKKFFSLTYDPLDPAGLHDERVLKIVDDSRGNLWIATWTAGLSYYDISENQFTVYQHDPDDSGSISDDGIQDILVDKHDNLWVISASPALDVLRNGSVEFEHIEADFDDSLALQSQYLTSIYEDHEGYIWFGSWADGVFKLDPTTMIFQTFRDPSVNNITLGTVTTYSIFEDSNNLLWLGAEDNGILVFDQHDRSLKQFKSVPGDSSTLPSNDIMCFYEDSTRIIWMGSYGGGLIKFDPHSNTFTYFGLESGMLNTTIYKIFEDSHGHLWMSTNNGLARFDKELKTFRTYTIADGVLSKEFNPAGCMNDQGWLYFGGVRGVTYFNPDQIVDNPHVPPIQFTKLSIMNHPIKIGERYNGRVVLETTLLDRPLIRLYPEDLFFSLSFASLDYYHPATNAYAYYLKGFDNNWRFLGSQHNVTFTNLAPGTYTLFINGSNNDGVWNEDGTSLQIKIYPEFYEAWWFISILVLLMGISVFLIFRLRTNFLIRRGEELKQHNIRLNAEVKSRRKAHLKARERADYFRAVIAQSPVPMAIHNISGNITHLNSGWVDLWQVDRAEEIIRDYQVDSDSLAQQLDLASGFEKAISGEIVERPEVSFHTKEGQLRVVHVLFYPFQNVSGGTNQVMITLDEVTEIVRHRNLLEKSIVEKELLLKEVHHRVKNNLQIIASLLGLQKSGLTDSATILILDEFRNRVNSMALVHDALYRSPEFDNIDFAQYIRHLIQELNVSFKLDSSALALIAEIPEINLSVDLAIPCGLMINELVTNALKYAFPEPTPDNQQISIKIAKLEHDFLRVEVQDNGIGFQQPVVWDSVASLGLYLVKILSEKQLMGSVELVPGAGAHFVIEFPLHPDFDN